MIRFLWRLFAELLFGRKPWSFPVFIGQPARLLYDAALTMSTVFVGRQGAGKTFAAAQEQLEQMKAHPEQPFFIFDWSGSLINTLLQLILSDPKRDELLSRLVYDAMGGRTINGKPYIMPLPGFSEKYDPEKRWLERVEDQVDRERRVFAALYADLIERNPTMYGRPINDLLPNILSLLNAVTDENGKSFQITEAATLLSNKQDRDNARKRFGSKVGKANEYFKELFKGVAKLEKDIAQALIDILDVLKTQRLRSRVGFPDPSWTPKEVIERGLIYLGDGSGLNNNRKQKDYCFLQLFYLILDEINKRVPSAPGYAPINWVMDEIFTFTEIKGSNFLIHFVTEYRNRGLCFTLILQSLKQLPGEANGIKGLEDMFFTFGNIIVFSLLDIDDCMAVAKNLFPFDPQLVKVPAKHEEQHDIMENRDEQIAIRAYQLQHLAKRECFVRRFIDEGRMDKVIHIGKTRDVRITATYEDVERLKDKFMLERGVPLAYAERLINRRKRLPMNQPSEEKKQSGKQKEERKPKGV